MNEDISAVCDDIDAIKDRLSCSIGEALHVYNLYLTERGQRINREYAELRAAEIKRQDDAQRERDRVQKEALNNQQYGISMIDEHVVKPSRRHRQG